jgi:hypothetical protein
MSKGLIKGYMSGTFDLFHIGNPFSQLPGS